MRAFIPQTKKAVCPANYVPNYIHVYVPIYAAISGADYVGDQAPDSHGYVK